MMGRQPETELTAGTEWLVSHTTIAWGQNSFTGFAVVPTGDHIDLAWHQSSGRVDKISWQLVVEEKEGEAGVINERVKKIERKGIKSDSTGFDLGGEGDD